MGECGPCEGLGEGVEHTDKRKVVEIQPAAPAESVDCGTPGTPSDIRRQGCTIPVDGSTADLTCCESCCQVRGQGSFLSPHQDPDVQSSPPKSVFEKLTRPVRCHLTAGTDGRVR